MARRGRSTCGLGALPRPGAEGASRLSVTLAPIKVLPPRVTPGAVMLGAGFRANRPPPTAPDCIPADAIKQL